jgi:hypothetical protein
VSNPRYQAPEVLSGIAETGAVLNLAGWESSRAVHLGTSGVQELELDSAVLGAAREDLADIRLISGDRQIPFVLERTSLTREWRPVVKLVPDPTRPGVSRWSLTFPPARPGVVLQRLVLKSATTLFERELTVYENADDRGGAVYPVGWGRALWRRVPGTPPADLVMEFGRPCRSGTLWLETDNGDNPPITLTDVCAYHPVTRLVFKASPRPGEVIRLCYGNPEASAPLYDLRLVADELLSAGRNTATVEGPTAIAAAPGAAGDSLRQRILFWGVLTLVVVALLGVLAKLLPAEKPPT